MVVAGKPSPPPIYHSARINQPIAKARRGGTGAWVKTRSQRGGPGSGPYLRAWISAPRTRVQ